METNKPDEPNGAMTAELERLRMEKALLETQSECSPDGVVVVSPDGNVLHSNRRFADLWKLKAQPVHMEPCGDIWKEILGQLTEPARIVALVEALAVDHARTVNGRWRLLDGRTVECYSAPVRHSTGASFGRLWSCRDVTEQVHLQEQVRDAQRLESIGVVAAGIAHEFKNILGPILGNAELARLELPAGHPAHQWLEQIIKSTLTARDLAQQILTFGRQVPSGQKPLSVGEIISDSVRFLRAMIPKSVEVSFVVAPGLPRVLMDANQIQQVMMNLGINAWQAMETGAGQITIRADLVSSNEALALELPDGRYVRFTISDTGKGMDAETLQRLFDPFFTTKPVGEGTGLGLAVVHGIVKSHRGVIHVTSSPGAGAAFEIYLPAADSLST
jgi:two-component system cell cycle sensor histidine kinase/response regulator CckA